MIFDNSKQNRGYFIVFILVLTLVFSLAFFALLTEAQLEEPNGGLEPNGDLEPPNGNGEVPPNGDGEETSECSSDADCGFRCGIFMGDDVITTRWCNHSTGQCEDGEIHTVEEYCDYGCTETSEKTAECDSSPTFNSCSSATVTICGDSRTLTAGTHDTERTISDSTNSRSETYRCNDGSWGEPVSSIGSCPAQTETCSVSFTPNPSSYFGASTGIVGYYPDPRPGFTITCPTGTTIKYKLIYQYPSWPGTAACDWSFTSGGGSDFQGFASHTIDSGGEYRYACDMNAVSDHVGVGFDELGNWWFRVELYVDDGAAAGAAEDSWERTYNVSVSCPSCDSEGLECGSKEVGFADCPDLFCGACPGVAPSGVSAVPICSASISRASITWTAGTGSSQYVQRCQGSDCNSWSTIVTGLATDATSYTDSGPLTYDAYYRYRVCNTDGCSSATGNMQARNCSVALPPYMEVVSITGPTTVNAGEERNYTATFNWDGDSANYRWFVFEDGNIFSEDEGGPFNITESGTGVTSNFNITWSYGTGNYRLCAEGRATRGTTATDTECINVTVESDPSFAELLVESQNPSSGVVMTSAQCPGTTSYTCDVEGDIDTNLTAPLTANGNDFSYWTGCDASTGTTCSVSIPRGDYKEVTVAYSTPLSDCNTESRDICGESGTLSAGPDGTVRTITDSSGAASKRYECNNGSWDFVSDSGTCPGDPSEVFDFNPSAGNITIQQGQSADNTVGLSLDSGTAETVSLSVISSLPDGVTIGWPSGSSCLPSCSRALRINVADTTTTGSYTITVRGTGGGVTRDRNFTLTVSSAPPPPSDVNLTASPLSVSCGGSTTLNWTTQNADFGCSWTEGLSGPVSPLPNGSISVSPSVTTSYRMDCSGSGGNSWSGVTVSYVQDLSKSCLHVRSTKDGNSHLGVPITQGGGSQTPSTGMEGTTSYSRAYSGDIRNVRLNAPLYDTDPIGLGTGTITAAGWGPASPGECKSLQDSNRRCVVDVDVGSEKTVTVKYETKPIIIINANPTIVDYGNSTEITWEAHNVNNCVAWSSPSNADWDNLNKPLSGSQVITPLESGNNSFVLSCTGPYGDGEGWADVDVQGEPELNSVDISPKDLTVMEGDSAVFTASINGDYLSETRYRLDCGNGQVVDITRLPPLNVYNSGSLTCNYDVAGSYTATITVWADGDGLGPVSDTAQVRVKVDIFKFIKRFFIEK